MVQYTLYSHAAGPNGWKVAIVLKALGLTFETKYLDFGKGEHKAEDYTKINPNGRIPSLVDNETGYQLWETGAIITYLVEKYDKDLKISVSGDDKYDQLKWLFFQVSGQGPYFGQATWFMMFHSEKIPSAIERYQNEVARVFSVLDSVLSKQAYLVADRPTVADFAFIPWNITALRMLTPPGTDVNAKYPALVAWHEKLMALPFVKETFEEKAKVADH